MENKTQEKYIDVNLCQVLFYKILRRKKEGKSNVKCKSFW